MSNNIVYADTVGIDGTVYPTIGENIITGGPVFIYCANKDIFLIRLMNKNIKTTNTYNFLRNGVLNGNMAIAIRDGVNSDMSGEVTLLIGVI